MRADPSTSSLSALASGFVAVVAVDRRLPSGALVPRTVDGPVRTSVGVAVAADLALLLLFALQHSVMARRRSSVAALGAPASLERTTFVLATDLCLVLLLVLWQPWAAGRPGA